MYRKEACSLQSVRARYLNKIEHSLLNLSVKNPSCTRSNGAVMPEWNTCVVLFLSLLPLPHTISFFFFFFCRAWLSPSCESLSESACTLLRCIAVKIVIDAPSLHQRCHLPTLKFLFYFRIRCFLMSMLHFSSHFSSLERKYERLNSLLVCENKIISIGIEIKSIN